MNFFLRSFIVVLMSIVQSSAANMLGNSNFEISGTGKISKSGSDILKNWTVNLNSSNKQVSAELSPDAFEGKKSLRLNINASTGFVSADYNKVIPVKTGQKCTASIMLKGTGKGFIRLYYCDAAGALIPKEYHMAGNTANPDKWEELVTGLVIPENVHGLIFSVQVLQTKNSKGSNVSVCFDSAKLELNEAAILENSKLKVELNPRLGGCIDAFILKNKKIDFTRRNTMAHSGGMMNNIIPAKRNPGIFKENQFTVETLNPGKSIRMYMDADSGELSGLKLIKEFTLDENKPELKVTITATNNSGKKLKLSHRIQNIVSAKTGTFSWPTADWLQIFEQNGAPLNGLDSVVNKGMRAGWIARFYKECDATLFFGFDLDSVHQTYSYINSDFDTMEWYYNDIELPAGKSWKSESVIRVIEEQKTFYVDDAGKNQKIEPIKLIKMPSVPTKTKLPPQFDGYFPFASGLGNLLQPEMAGIKGSSNEQHVKRDMRIARIMVDNYFNTIRHGTLLRLPKLQKAFRDVYGKHILGEFVREHGIKLIMGSIFLHRNDINPDEYMKKKGPEELSFVQNTEQQRFIKEYQDVIPLIFTADEIQAHNADVMLRVHSELKKFLPDHIITFPYLNSSATALIPYLPVFLGDWYPIKRPNFSGRNPWSVEQEFSSVVQKAGDTPVWFMPQGFAARKTDDAPYSLPTAGEARLMINLAIGVGVRGIIWYGFPSGTWSWMINYEHNYYAFLGGAGQRTEGWAGVVDCAKDVATIGHLLAVSHPCAVPAEITLFCGKYRDTIKNYYNGLAIKLFALKTPEGILLMLVNQNPYAAETGNLGITGSAFDITTLTPLTENNIKISFPPGGCHYIYLGKSENEIDSIFAERLRHEISRYKLAAVRAAGNSISGIDLKKISLLPPPQAWAEFNKELLSFENRVSSSNLGKVLASLETTRKRLDDIDFKFACAIDLLVTPEMRKKTPKYRRWCEHPDRIINQVRERIASDFFEFYRISDMIDAGANADLLEKETLDIEARVQKDCSEANAMLKNCKTIDNPYK